MVTTPEKFDLSSIKLALEHATFKDYNIRDAINTLLKSIELDLDEIGFEPSDNTREVIEALENVVSEIEGKDKHSKNIISTGPIDIESDVDDEGIIEVAEIISNDDEDEDNNDEPRVVNVDEELEEFDG